MGTRSGMSVVELTGESYEQTRASGIVLVDWRGPDDGGRGGFTEVYDSLSETNPDLTFATIDGEKESTLAGLAHVTTLPTLTVFRDGIEVFRTVDPLDPEELDAILLAIRDLDMEDVRLRLAIHDADDHRGG